MSYRVPFRSFSDACLSPRLRRGVLGAVLCAVGMMALPGAQAQTAYPAKPVTLLVPFPPGSATDAIGRALAAVVSKTLGQQVIVENRAGAAGTLAAGSLAQSNNPDGYTVAIAPASLFRIDTSEAGLVLVGVTLVTATSAAFAILASIQLLGAAKSSVLEISYPLFVALFSCWFFGGQLQLPVVIGGGFIFVGAAIIALAK